MKHRLLTLLLALQALPPHLAAQDRPLPIIDMHLHARDAPAPQRKLCLPVTVFGVVDPVCSAPLLSPRTDVELLDETVAVLERRNIYAVVSGDSLERVQRFRDAAPDRMIPAYQLDLGDDEALTPEALRPLLRAGDFQVLGEIENQYAGLAPNDPRMDPYWALAEELEIPVALHLGEGYPGLTSLGSPSYRVRLGNPLLLEDVLVRHPDLRIYVMHYGSPMLDEMIGILYAYPQVYVDIGGNTWPYPPAFFYGQLERLVDAGFGKRILFGTDQMVWPGLIEKSIAILEGAPFLTEEQKRDILYNNAARFLRLAQETIAVHHGR